MTRRARGSAGQSSGRGSDALPGGRSQRQLRVGEEIRHILSDALRQAHFRDPDLADLVVTVTEVRVSPDLKNATAFVIPLTGKSGSGAAERVVAGLNRAQSYIRSLVAEPLNLRHAPSLSFKLDHSFDNAQRIDQVLHRPEVRADIEKATPSGEDDAS